MSAVVNDPSTDIVTHLVVLVNTVSEAQLQTQIKRNQGQTTQEEYQTFYSFVNGVTAPIGSTPLSPSSSAM